MTTPTTALQALKILLPAILKWKNKKWSGINITIFSPTNQIDTDGKASDWQINVFAPVANKRFSISLNAEEINNQLKPKLDNSKILDLHRIQTYSLLDSDWAIQKALELGLPQDEQKQIRARISGQVAWASEAGQWSFFYSKSHTEEWELRLDMKTGDVISHKCIRYLEPSLITRIPPISSNVTKKHSSYVKSIALSHDGQFLASANGDGTVELWEIVTGKSILLIDGYILGNNHTLPANTVVFSPDDKFLAIGGDVAIQNANQAIQIWEIKAQRMVIAFKAYSSLTSFAFTPSFEFIYGVNSIAFNKDGKYLAAGTTEGNVVLWDTTTYTELGVLVGHAGSVQSIIFNSADGTLISGGTDKTVRIWDINAKQELKILRNNITGVYSLGLSPDGNLLAIGSSKYSPREINNKQAENDVSIKLWNIMDKDELSTLLGHKDTILSLAFSPDGKNLASGGIDKTVRIWDINTKQELMIMMGHSTSVSSLLYSSDGKTLVSGGGVINFWDLTTGKIFKTL